jgi:hypothetical protein
VALGSSTCLSGQVLFEEVAERETNPFQKAQIEPHAQTKGAALCTPPALSYKTQPAYL